MAKIIYDSQINDFLDHLVEVGPVYVPTEADLHSFSSQFTFKEYQKGDNLALNYPVTVLSPKEFLLPAKDILFSFNEFGLVAPKKTPQTIFGLSLEDLEAVSRLGKIFSEPIYDQPFMERFEKTMIVAVDKYSPPVDINYDLYLQEIESGVYLASAATKKGRTALSGDLFSDHQRQAPKTKTKKDPILFDPLLSTAVKNSKNHPVWEELTKTCFGCGICSYVCPLCYCFDMTDELDFGTKQVGIRCRNWDSCMLKSFAGTATGNFRPDLKDRIYNWYFHKFVRMPREYGFSGCVDCSRCVIYCPAKINYRKVLRVVLEDYKKKVKK